MEMSSTDKRIDEVSDRIGRFESRVERFESRVERFEDKVESRFDKVDDRANEMVTKDQFEKADSETKERFVKVEASIAALGNKIDTTNRTLLGGIVVAVAVRFLFG